MSNLACDIQPSGGRSFRCARLPGSLCNSNMNCANNLDCIKTSANGQAFCNCQVYI